MKTLKVMATSKALKAHMYAVGERLYMCTGYIFELVQEFKYLGLLFDSSALDKVMIGQALTRAKQALGMLVAHLNTRRWRYPIMRLVLGDVYARSVL